MGCTTEESAHRPKSVFSVHAEVLFFAKAIQLKNPALCSRQKNLKLKIDQLNIFEVKICVCKIPGLWYYKDKV